MNNLRQKIGQMLMVGFQGQAIDDRSDVADWLQTDGLGGVLLFDHDVKTNTAGKNLIGTDQIKQLINQLNHYSQLKQSIPLFIALDYEGGSVDRLRNIPGCPPTLPASEQVALDDLELYNAALQMALTLKNLGFNLNFAPIVDVNLNSEQGIIGRLGRSFSSQPKDIIRAAKLFVKAFNDQGIVAAYKHFPGHGSAIGDSHYGFVDVTSSFNSTELEPYIALLQEQDQHVMVMTAHVINRQLDSSGLPATLSQAILNKLLRQQLGYDGVIISDDLQMHAISHSYGFDQMLELTINAGADMLIFANQLAEVSATEVIDRIESLVVSGAIPMQRIEQAFQRICKLKHLL
ncbi:MAG: glycoside hydrolase family 3 protein [Legionella sp.]